MAMTTSHGLPLGTAAPPFSLPGVDGRAWSLDSFAEADALVVVFTCNHCPVAVATEDRFVELQRDYGDRLRLVAINPNDAVGYPEDSFEAMKKRAAEKGFNFPYLRDETQEVARAYDARCTPDIFLFGRDRKLAYAGRLDDNWKDPEAVTRRDLRAAVDAVLAGRPIEIDVHPATGCSIKWKR
jgi:peroxiredoxin